MNWNNSENENLIKAILSLETDKEAKAFLRDLMTEKEIEEFAKRLKAAKMLFAQSPYSEIEKETGLSSTTVARVSKWLNRPQSGYKMILNKIHHCAHLSREKIDRD